MTPRSLTLAAVGAIAATTLFTGCSTVNTPPDRVALHYSGGPLSDQEFQECIPRSTRDMMGPGEKFYEYPTRQVSYDASTDDIAERGRFAVVSKDSADLYVPVSVTFTLVTECETLRKMHETLGLKYGAYAGGGGWVDMLNFIVGKPLDATLDRIALRYNWEDMRTDPTVKDEIEREINNAIEGLVTRQAGGSYFENFSALVQKPDPQDPALLEAIADKQARVTAAEAARAEADAQVDTAKAQQRLARAEADRLRQQILGFRLPGMTNREAVEAYRKSQMAELGLNPDQPTYVMPGAPAPAPKAEEPAQ